MPDPTFWHSLWKTWWRNCLQQKGPFLVLFSLRQLIDSFLVVFYTFPDFPHILFMFLEIFLIVICFWISGKNIYCFCIFWTCCIALLFVESFLRVASAEFENNFSGAKVPRRVSKILKNILNDLFIWFWLRLRVLSQSTGQEKLGRHLCRAPAVHLK